MELKVTINKKPPWKIFKYSDADWSRIRTETNSFSRQFIDSDWTRSNRSVSDNWNSLKNHIKVMMDKHVPHKQSKSNYQLPWLTPSIRKLIRKKNSLYFKARNSRKSEHWVKYKECRRAVQRALRSAEWNYINNILETGLVNNDSKPFWKYIKSKQQDNTGIAPLRDGSILHTDSKSKADILNKQFKSVFTKREPSAVPQTLPGVPYEHVKQLVINENGVLKLLQVATTQDKQSIRP